MVCKFCDQEMIGVGADSCKNLFVNFPNGERILSVPFYGDDDLDRCHDCNILSGGLHHPGCGMERCPKCKCQIISCGHLDPS